MAYSAASICNQALAKIGAGRITALTDNSEPARVCNSIYAEKRDSLLDMTEWDFATRRVQLARDVTAPTFGYDYAYQLPADIIALLEVFSGSDGGTKEEEYTREKGMILTDQDYCWVRYTQRIEDEAQFSVGFAEALAYLLAIDLAGSLAKSVRLIQKMEQGFEGTMQKFAAQSHAGLIIKENVGFNTFTSARN